MGYIPRRPVGISAAAVFMQAVWDYLWGNQFPFTDTDTIKWDRTSRGYAANLVPQRNGGSPAAKPMYPFRIYQANNIANQVDNWRTFQMRAGAIGFRSKYWLPGAVAAVGSGNNADGGNFENIIDLIAGSDQQDYFENNVIPLAGNLVALDNSQDTIIAPLVPGKPVQFMLDNHPDDLGIYEAGIWVAITDDPVNGLSAQLHGQMFSDTPADSTGRGQVPFPAGSPLIVPIGIVVCGSYPAGNQVFDGVVQLQYGNLINRYAPTGGGFASSMTSFRGDWTNDKLVGQVFWPGELVSYTYGNPQVTNLFIHNNTIAKEPNPPTLSNNFKLFSKIA